MTHINEDKRKTENRIAMLEIMNNIENCPVNIIIFFILHPKHIMNQIFIFYTGYVTLITS